MRFAQPLFILLLSAPTLHAGGRDIDLRVPWEGERSAVAMSAPAVPASLRVQAPTPPIPRRDGGAGLQLPEGVPVLFVTHATLGYDENAVARRGADRAVAAFKKNGWPVLYLVDCRGSRTYAPYTSDRFPTAAICSSGGEHRVPLGARPVYIAGGFFEACAENTVVEALASQALGGPVPKGGLDLHYVADGVYSFGYTVAECVSPEGMCSTTTREWLHLFAMVRWRLGSPSAGDADLKMAVQRKGSVLLHLRNGKSADALTLTVHLDLSEELENGHADLPAVLPPTETPEAAAGRLLRNHPERIPPIRLGALPKLKY